MPKAVVYKTIFQARFKPDLRFHDIFRSAARRLEGYPDWATDANSVTLRDFENHSSVLIRHNQFTLEQELGGVETETVRTKAALDVLPQSLGIRAFNRLGYRRQCLVPVEMPFASLVSVLHIKLFSQDARLANFMPSRFEDLLYRVDCADEQHQFHFWVGPLRKQEIPNCIAFNVENHLAPESRDEKLRAIVAKYPDTSVLLDIDVYRSADAIPLPEAECFLLAARQKVDTLCKDLTEYLFNERIEYGDGH